jgi:hypothetical protein
VPGSVVITPDQLGDNVKIATYAKSVARLAIRNDYYQTSDLSQYLSFWGTGFLVGSGIIATPCHVIGSLIDDKHHLLKLDHESLVIDFAATPDTDTVRKVFEVKSVIGCPDSVGLDIALLDLCTGEGSQRVCPTDLPQMPLPLFAGSIKSMDSKPLLLIGYADLNHFMNPDRRAMYDPWVSSPVSSKFVVADHLIDEPSNENQCRKSDDGLTVMLDTVITTTGESGSVVIKLNDGATLPAVIGVHTCCSGYFEYDKGNPPEPELKCARLHRTLHNQDISSLSILHDPKLCPILRDHGASAINEDGSLTQIVCPIQ